MREKGGKVCALRPGSKCSRETSDSNAFIWIISHFNFLSPQLSKIAARKKKNFFRLYQNRFEKPGQCTDKKKAFVVLAHCSLSLKRLQSSIWISEKWQWSVSRNLLQKRALYLDSYSVKVWLTQLFSKVVQAPSFGGSCAIPISVLRKSYPILSNIECWLFGHLGCRAFRM